MKKSWFFCLAIVCPVVYGFINADFDKESQARYRSLANAFDVDKKEFTSNVDLAESDIAVIEMHKALVEQSLEQAKGRLVNSYAPAMYKFLGGTMAGISVASGLSAIIGSVGLHRQLDEISKTPIVENQIYRQARGRQDKIAKLESQIGLNVVREKAGQLNQEIYKTKTSLGYTKKMKDLQAQWEEGIENKDYWEDRNKLEKEFDDIVERDYGQKIQQLEAEKKGALGLNYPGFLYRSYAPIFGIALSEAEQARRGYVFGGLWDYSHGSDTKKIMISLGSAAPILSIGALIAGGLAKYFFNKASSYENAITRLEKEVLLDDSMMQALRDKFAVVNG